MTSTPLRRFIISISMASLVIMAVWYGFLQPPYLSYGNLPFPVLRDPYPGEAVLLRVRRCNSDDKTRVYAISHRLVSETPGTPDIVLPAALASVPPGCTTSNSVANVIPMGTPPGRYVVEGFGESSTLLRDAPVFWYSEPFSVLAGVAPK